MQKYKTTITKTTSQEMEVEIEFPLYLKTKSGLEVVRFVSETDGIELTQFTAIKAMCSLKYYLQNDEPATAKEFNDMALLSEFNIRKVLHEAIQVPSVHKVNEKIRKQVEFENLRLAAGNTDHEDIRLQEAQDMEEALVHHYEKDSHE